MCTMFADVTHHQPVDTFPGAVLRSLVLYKGNMPPGGGGQGKRVVVAMPT